MGKKKPTEADAGRLARKAAEILEDRGVAQGALVKTQRRHGKVVEETFCTAGALNFAYCGNANLTRSRIENIPLLKLTYSLVDALVQDISADIPIPRRPKTLEQYNDLATNDEDVIRILHKVADNYDPKKY